MLRQKIQLLSVSLSMGLVIGMTSTVNVNASEIDSLNDFYDYYGNDFSVEEKEIIEGVFSNIEKYLEPNGLDIAIADGFIPFTRPWEYHGTHWFNPSFVDLTNIQANPFLPIGLNVDKDGQIRGGFWAQELYEPITPLINNLDLANIDPATLTQLYGQYQQTVQPIPDAFDVFGDEAQWHTHKNVIIENVGAKNEQGELDPYLIEFRQSLPNEDFINELIASLMSEEIVLGPVEPADFNLDYPYYNRAISPGFYMIHMWFGLGNVDGLFAGINKAISVPEDAINESQTFEDGSDGHGHGHGHGDGSGGQDPQTVPEPSSIIGLVGFALLGLKKLLS